MRFPERPGEHDRVDVVFDFVSPPAARAGLGDGYAVYLRIVEWQADNVLQVPLSALFRRGDDWAVFAVGGDGVVRLRTVGIGRRNDRAAQVTAGLEAGARVVTHPSDRVGDGVAIIDRATLETAG